MVWGPGTIFFEFSMKNPIQNNPQISISWKTFFWKIEKCKQFLSAQMFGRANYLQGQLFGTPISVRGALWRLREVQSPHGVGNPNEVDL